MVAVTTLSTRRPTTSVPILKAFKAIPSDSGFLEFAPYADHNACDVLLKTVLADFGIGPWQLSKIIGTASYLAVNLWMKGQRRPNQLYVSRMLMVYHLARQGTPIAQIESIDWDNGVIKWRRKRHAKP